MFAFYHWGGDPAVEHPSTNHAWTVQSNQLAAFLDTAQLHVSL